MQNLTDDLVAKAIATNTSPTQAFMLFNRLAPQNSVIAQALSQLMAQGITGQSVVEQTKIVSYLAMTLAQAHTTLVSQGNSQVATLAAELQQAKEEDAALSRAIAEQNEALEDKENELVQVGTQLAAANAEIVDLKNLLIQDDDAADCKTECGRDWQELFIELAFSMAAGEECRMSVTAGDMSVSTRPEPACSQN